MDPTPMIVVVQAAVDKPTSVWEVLSAVGTVGATFVALSLGLYQWWKDRRRQGDVRAALSKALATDMAAWRAIVDVRRTQFGEKKLESEDLYVEWVQGLVRPVMPTHERFYMMLPDLGRDISMAVVHAYAEAMRIGELIEQEIHKRGTKDRDYVAIAGDIRPHLDLVSDNLKAAADVLRPYEESSKGRGHRRWFRLRK
jgi:hypothetical protein